MKNTFDHQRRYSGVLQSYPVRLGVFSAPYLNPQPKTTTAEGALGAYGIVIENASPGIIVDGFRFL